MTSLQKLITQKGTAQNCIYYDFLYLNIQETITVLSLRLHGMVAKQGMVTFEKKKLVKKLQTVITCFITFLRRKMMALVSE